MNELIARVVREFVATLDAVFNLRLTEEEIEAWMLELVIPVSLQLGARRKENQ